MRPLFSGVPTLPVCHYSPSGGLFVQREHAVARPSEFEGASAVLFGEEEEALDGTPVYGNGGTVARCPTAQCAS